MSEVTKPIALDESINTTENTPRNIADVLADELSNIADKIQGGGSGGSGGHIIQNASGANLTQRNTMQFTDAHVSDDSINEKTKVEVIKSVTEAQFESATEDGLYDVDVEGAEIGEISEEYVGVTADGEKTYAELLNTIFAMADTSKINQDSCFVVVETNTFIAYPCYFGGSSEFRFTYSRISQIASVFMTYKLSSSSGHYQDNNGTRTDESTSKPSSGTKLTLYYGNDKAVVDLQTTANRCLMPNGNSVEQILNNLFTIKEYTIASTDLSQLSYFGATAYLGQVTTETATYGSIISVTARDTSNYPCVCQVKSDNNLNIIGTANRDFIVRVVYSK